MSLRLRLLLSLLAIAAVGLVVVDAVSYGSLRSYLSRRVDQQIESARQPAATALVLRSNERQVRARLRALGIAPGAIGGVGSPPPGANAPGAPAGVASIGLPPPQTEQLPPGTYGALVDDSGRKIIGLRFGYGGSAQPTPQLPKPLPVSALSGPAHTFTTGSAGGGSTEFRGVAFRPQGASFTVVVAVPLNDYKDTLRHVARLGAIVTAAVLIGLALLAWWLIGVGLRPLQEIGVTAGRIAGGDLSQRVADTNPRTEVGQLGAALNAILGQIEAGFEQRRASEQRMRRFLADASHELRTPLTSIRGYAEVFGMGAAQDPKDVAKAMRGIERESTRMSGMVDDLLALARLDEVRQPVREQVELRELAAQACDDAGAAAPDREISLEASRSVTVSGDPDQLRRAIGNLLGNAIAHTPPGSPIEVSLSEAGGRAHLSVRDHGPGIPDHAREQVFERFWRQSRSRGRGDGGAGLGLAIVAAVATAHGGGVEAANDPRGGAVFTIELPLATAAARAAGNAAPGR